MSDNDSGFLWVMFFVLWGIPLIFWGIRLSSEWSTWQLILLWIAEYISPGIAIALYVWITED